MKVVILAGGLPSNISEEAGKIPKPMVRIGDRPVLWHIMKSYSSYGFNDFIICTGYKAELIKEYFLDYYIYSSDITVDLQKNDIIIHNKVIAAIFIHQSLSLKIYFKLAHYLFKATIFTKHCTLSLEDHKIK